MDIEVQEITMLDMLVITASITNIALGYEVWDSMYVHEHTKMWGHTLTSLASASLLVAWVCTCM